MKKARELPPRFTKEQHEIFTRFFFKVYPLCSIWDDIEQQFWAQFRTRHALDWLNLYGARTEIRYLQLQSKVQARISSMLMNGWADAEEKQLYQQIYYLLGWNMEAEDAGCKNTDGAGRPQKRFSLRNLCAKKKNRVAV